MRKQFDNDLEILNSHIDEAENCCLQMLETSALLLENPDESALYVFQIEQYRHIRTLCHLADQECLDLLLKEQPVAGDLRLINLSGRISADLARIAKLNLDFSNLCRNKEIEKMKKPLTEMSALTRQVLKTTAQARRQFSRETAARAIDLDDAADQAFEQIRSQLISKSQDSITKEEALSLLTAAKYLERIADHGVRMAQAICALAD